MSGVSPSTPADFVPSNTLCRWHEEAAARRVSYWNTSTVTEDIPLQDHLTTELKMSLMMLRELEFQILDLGLSIDAWRTSTTEKTARRGDDPDGRNTYVESKKAALHGAHPVLVQYLREREHHLKVVQMCISAGFAQKQLAVVERYVESLVSSQLMLAESLGHDPRDPAVRAVIMDVVRRKQLELEETRGMGGKGGLGALEAG